MEKCPFLRKQSATIKCFFKEVSKHRTGEFYNYSFLMLLIQLGFTGNRSVGPNINQEGSELQSKGGVSAASGPGDSQERCWCCHRGNVNNTIQTPIKNVCRDYATHVQGKCVSVHEGTDGFLSPCSWMKTTSTCSDHNSLLAAIVAAGVYFISRCKSVLYNIPVVQQ